MPRSVRHVFRHFCRSGGDVGCPICKRDDAKVKLFLYGGVVSLRKNGVCTKGGPGRKTFFEVLLPLRGNVPRTGSRGRGCRRGRRPLSVPTGKGRGGRAVLVIRSGTSVHACVYSVLGGGCRLGRTRGNTRTLCLVRERAVSLVIDSLVVPIVSKGRLSHQMGTGLTASRVPFLVLATLQSRTRREVDCRVKMSRCLYGPFSRIVLELHVQGVLTLHRGCGSVFSADVGYRALGVGTDSGSGAFVASTVGLVGRRCTSSSCGLRHFVHSVKCDGALIGRGLRSLAKRSVNRFVEGCQLGITGSALAGMRYSVSITRVTCTMNFGSPGCFAGYFGRLFKMLPDRCFKGG